MPNAQHDVGPADDPPLIVEHAPTEDGGTVALKRRPQPGGPPVMLIHGLAVNADLWDLPSIDTPDYAYRSLATCLRDAGWDVWLVNLRGHGRPRMYSTPPPGQSDWCVDHFIVFDLPAAVAHVRRATGARPFIVGASMGAMTLAGYLCGTRWASAAHDSLTADADLARRRQSELCGAVFAEFPAVLRWPDSPFDAAGRPRWSQFLRWAGRTDAGVNFPFEFAARLGWLEALIMARGGVPLDRLRPRGPNAVLEALPPGVAAAFRQVERAITQAGLNVMGLFNGSTNHRAEVLLHGRRYVLEEMKAGVLRQMAASIRAGSFVSLLGSPTHDYPSHYPLIELPTLLVLGGRDRIANADITRQCFFERIAADDKQLMLFEWLGHGEIEAAPVATAQIYPGVMRWLAARADAAPQPRPTTPAADD